MAMNTENTGSVLIADNLHIGIANRSLCKCLNLQLKPGQCWGLLGRNGAGKTILLHTLAGLCSPIAGHILLNGVESKSWQRRSLARHVGLLLQQRVVHFPATVETVVLAGRYPHLGLWKAPASEDHALVQSALLQVGLIGIEQRLVSSLSGGEQQRVYLAALLAQQPAASTTPVNNRRVGSPMRVRLNTNTVAPSAPPKAILGNHVAEIPNNSADNIAQADPPDSPKI